MSVVIPTEHQCQTTASMCYRWLCTWSQGSQHLCHEVPLWAHQDCSTEGCEFVICCLYDTM